MYLRHLFLNLKSIRSVRFQTVDKLIYRTLSHQHKHENKNKIEISQINKSADKEDDDDNDGSGLRTIVETTAARKAREKAEWDRLSFVEKFVKKFFPSQINSIAILVVCGVVYVIYEQLKNDYEIKYTFRNGSCPNFKFKEEQLLERKSLLDPLITIVTPVADKLVSSYYIVIGEHGSGKSTLIRQAARKVGPGVIYVDVPSNADKFGFAFARAIRFNFKEHIRLSTWIESKMFGSPPDDGKEASWERVLITFEKYAIDFKKKYGSVPVLIFDNCDNLANKDPGMLEILQDTAKTAIDDSKWVTVFVTSVGNAPEQMEGRSSITRASSFFEISDLSKEEAMMYLTEKRNLSKEVANEIYALFGGRIKSLQSAASKLQAGVEFSTIRKSTLHDIARRIEKIRCRTNTQEQTFLFNVLCGLLNQTELTVDQLINMEEDVTVRQKILDELRNETILMRSVSTSEYTYNSQAIKLLDTPSVSLPNNNINQMIPIVDALLPEQAFHYHHQQQHDERCSSTNEIKTTTSDRFPLWNNHSSALTICSETTDRPSAFVNQCQSTLHSSSHSVLNTSPHHHQQQQQQRHYRLRSLTQPYFTSSSIYLPSAATVTVPSRNNTSGRKRSASSSLSTNNTDYKSCFTDYLSTIHLLSATLAGSHDQIPGNTNAIAPFISSDVMHQTSSTSTLLSRNTSITDAQPNRV